MSDDWIVYILKCSDGSYYTGITKNLAKRLGCHNDGKASKYTRARLPVQVLIYRYGFTKSEALKLEIKIKKQKKNNKVSYLENYSKIKENNAI